MQVSETGLRGPGRQARTWSLKMGANCVAHVARSLSRGDVGAERAPGQGTPSGKNTVKTKVNSGRFPGEESWKDSSPGNPCDKKW